VYTRASEDKYIGRPVVPTELRDTSKSCYLNNIVGKPSLFKIPRIGYLAFLLIYAAYYHLDLSLEVTST